MFFPVDLNINFYPITVLINKTFKKNSCLLNSYRCPKCFKLSQCCMYKKLLFVCYILHSLVLLRILVKPHFILTLVQHYNLYTVHINKALAMYSTYSTG